MQRVRMIGAVLVAALALGGMLAGTASARVAGLTAPAQPSCPPGTVEITGGIATGLDPGENVCIPAGASVIIDGATDWNTLTLIGSLQIGYQDPCGTYANATLSLDNGGTVDAGGLLSMFSSNSCGAGAPSSLTISAGTLDNAGTIDATNYGQCSGDGWCYADGGDPTRTSGRNITGSVLNTGTVEATSEPMQLAGPGTFDNQGTVSVAGACGCGQSSAGAVNIGVTGGENFINDTGGQFDASYFEGGGDSFAGPNELYMNGGTFTQGAGTISTAGDGTTPNPEPVILTSTSLDYTGAGASTIFLGGAATLAGAIASDQSLTIGGSQTSCPNTVTANASITNSGTITLSGEGCNGPTTLDVASGTLTNTGTIVTAPYGGQFTSSCNGLDCILDGNVVNRGTVTDSNNNDLILQGPGTFENEGVLKVFGGCNGCYAGVSNIYVQGGENFINATGGAIDADVTSGTPNQLLMIGGTFVQGAGTISATGLDGTTPNPDPVLIDGSNLTYTGGGAGAITWVGSGELKGNIAQDQTLTLGGMSFDYSPVEGNTITASASFTNAGTIAMGGQGPCCGGSGPSTTLAIANGTMTNTGTFQNSPLADSPWGACWGNAGCAVTGTIVNKGDFYVNYPYLTVLGSGSSITQAGGTMAIAGGDYLDLRSTSAATLPVTGGVLEGGGILYGSVVNTHGDVRAGTLTSPEENLLLTGSYHQEAGGTLTALIAGTDDYNQLTARSGSSLAGTLQILTAPAFSPAIGDTFEILNGGGVSGTFTTVTGQDPHHSSLGYTVVYDPSDVTLDVSQAAARRRG